MRTVALILGLGIAAGSFACSHSSITSTLVTSAKAQTATPAATAVATKVNFETQIKPILASRCQPCHFSGGKVYAKLPFDRPETIKTLGTKLFTRIKDENQRRLISDFLSQQ